jgi:hypothetical protein
MTQKVVVAVVFAMLFGFAGEASAGWRDLLLIYEQPPGGVKVGDTVPLVAMTSWHGQPLPNQIVYVTAHRPTYGGRTYPTTWVFRTDAEGLAEVRIEIAPFDFPGVWQVTAFTLGLPDGTSDGDGLTIPVAP